MEQTALSGRALTALSLPDGWEERWQRDKEQRRSAMEEGGERIEEEKRKLRWIVAYNNRRMGAKLRSGEEQDAEEEEDEEQMYHRRSHPCELLLSLEALRSSSLLTDLSLSTAGGTLHTHSPVMASISTLIRQHLQEWDRDSVPHRKLGDRDSVPHRKLGDRDSVPHQKLGDRDSVPHRDLGDRDSGDQGDRDSVPHRKLGDRDSVPHGDQGDSDSVPHRKLGDRDSGDQGDSDSVPHRKLGDRDSVPHRELGDRDGVPHRGLGDRDGVPHRGLGDRDGVPHRGLGDRDGVPHRGLSIRLGGDVEQEGLAAVVEFAYTGAIAGLNRHKAAQVRAAAIVLGAHRVLPLCTEEEEEKAEEGRSKEERKRREMEARLEGIQQLWVEQLGCDVELLVEGKAFPAHRVVLAACSEYFRGMFCSGMRESRQEQVQLWALEWAEFGELLRCCYSGRLQLGWDSVFEKTCTALQLQLRPALPLCLHFLRSHMDARSCLDVAAFAEAYGIRELQEEAHEFLLSRFQEVAATPKFRDLAVERLLAVLGSDELCTPSELTVFRAAVAWLQADPARLGVASEVMATVRFPLMTFREFQEVRAVELQMAVGGAGGSEGVELYGASFSRFGFSSSDSREVSRARHPRQTLVLVGGDWLDLDSGQRRPSGQLWFAHALRNHTGLVKDVQWRLLGEMPNPPRFRHGLGVLGGQLYVFGGCHFYAKFDTLKSAYRYDPVQDKWQRLADMQENRSNFSLVEREGRFYAIGGDRDINNNMDSVTCYCPNTDCWSLAHPLDAPLSGQAVALWEGQVFVSGGFNCRYQCLVSMFVYHPERGSSPLCSMGGDRALHCMESLGGRLYVAGGVCNLRSFYTDQLACEAYDPRSDCWTAIAPLPVPHAGAASAVMEGRFYVLGGYCQDDDSDTQLLHRYHPPSQTWENVGHMPGPNTDIRACLCTLPPHLRD